MTKYKCPKCGMIYDKLGKCTMDGTKLVKVEDGKSSNHSHTDHHKMMMEDFKKRFIISTILTIPILILSQLIQNLFNFSITLTGEKYILFVLSTLIFFYGGWPFLKGIYYELKEKIPGMMTLIALAISVAYFYSVAVVFGLSGEPFFWELATLIDIMLLGHWIEMRSVLGASKALEKLIQLLPDTAHLIKNKKVINVKIFEINKGDILLIKSGEKIPADGIIVKGNSYIDESMLTGESKPVKKNLNETVIGGSVNGDGVLEIRITGTGEESYLNKVINLVKLAQESKSKTQRLADKAANWLTIIAITAGVFTFSYWVIIGAELSFSIERMATVMVIACPHALGLAIPLVSAVSTSLSAKNGLLIRNRTAFENSRKITTIIFDKTGTLTEGKFGVSNILMIDKNYNENKLIQLAASLEQNSEHPIAEGILEKANKSKLLKVLNFKIIKGVGVEGKINDLNIKLVSKSYLEKLKIKVSMTIDEASTLVYVLVNNKPVGIIGLTDKVREDSFEAIKQLKESRIKCWMLTGDNKKIAEKVAKQLNLDGYFEKFYHIKN